MALTLNKIGITTGNTVEAYHVTQSIDAFTGTIAYDISLSGSFNVTGSVISGTTDNIANNFSHAEGQTNQATGYTSHAEGSNNFAIGVASHVEGAQNIASGSASHAEGQFTTSSGNYSHAEGGGSISIGSYSHAEGVNTISSGLYSHAEGSVTFSPGIASHSEGQFTTSSGQGSHAEGQSTIALGQGSHTEGWGTIASGSFQHVQGRFNTHGDSTTLMIVGNGVDNSTRRDAFRVRMSGSIVLPTTQSVAPSWTGTDGEIVPATVGGIHRLYMWMAGAWRSSSFS